MSSRALYVAFMLGAAGIARAQSPTEVEMAGRPLFVNDEWERYARVKQVVGDVTLYPWSSRDFSLRESELLAASKKENPWSANATLPLHRIGGLAWMQLPTAALTVLNSSFPYGYNDGAIWAGRGLTSAVRMGAATTAWNGRVEAVIAPVAFRAENVRYTLRPNGAPGAMEFGDAFLPFSIDQPQRFGNNAYERLDPGNSTIRLNLGPTSLGFSTANKHWGPARDHPLMLGNNAPGFPHVFLGSNSPVNMYVGKLYGRFLWGRLDCSPFTDMRQENRYRYATGFSAVLQPRGLPGLELGASRFFHLLWDDHVLTLANFTRSFIGITRNQRIDESGNPIGDEPDNQLGSVFARWVFPKSGFELYGEFGKDDYNADFRDLISEPDHIAGYLVGFQRVVRRPTNSYLVIRGELLNTRLSPLSINRPEAPFYIHSPVRQGHTNMGQVLGSVAAFGGGAAVIGVDQYSPAGRRSLSYSRIMRAEDSPGPLVPPNPQKADVFHALTWDGVAMRKRLAITYEVTGIYELNRDFQRDAFSMRFAAGLEYNP